MQIDSPLPISVQLVEQNYCNRQKEEVQLPGNVEEGLRVVDNILSKSQLCIHDRFMISEIFKAIDRAEQTHVFQASNSISNQILQKVIAKVNSISMGKIFLGDLISRYHLLSLLSDHLNFSVESYFNEFKIGLRNKNLNGCRLGFVLHKHLYLFSETLVIKSLATCSTVDQLDEEVAALFTKGILEDPELNSILSIKRGICKRQKELKNFQKKYPDTYPKCLDKILEYGFFNLYDHILEMKERLGLKEKKVNQNDVEEAIKKKTSCEEFVTIVLEMKRAIVKKVLESLSMKSYDSFFFLLGPTKAGKSTTLCFLRGDTMVVDDFKYRSEETDQQIIGQDDWSSYTLLPTVEIVGSSVFIDFPGFNDVHGPFVSLGMKLALRELASKARYSFQSKLHILLFAPFQVEEAGKSLKSLSEQIGNIFSDPASGTILCLTKYIKNVDFQRLEKSQEDLQNNLRKIEKCIENQLECEEELKRNPSKFAEKQRQKYLKKMEKLHQSNVDLQNEIEEKNRKITRIEQEIFSSIGAVEYLSLARLEQRETRTAILEKLKNNSLKIVCVHRYLELDASEESLLDLFFMKKIEKEIKERLEAGSKRVKSREIIKNGLLPTIFGAEFRDFFGEFTPDTQWEYDKAILDTVLKTFIIFAMKHIKEMSKKIGESDLDNLIKEMQSFETSAIEQWPLDEKDLEEEKTQTNFEKRIVESSIKDEIDERCKREIDNTEEALLDEILNYLFPNRKTNYVRQKCIETIEEEYAQKIGEFSDYLRELKEIRVMVEKKHLIHEVIEIPLSFESNEKFLSSIEFKIKRVRELYGPKEWKIVLNSLKSRIHLFKKHSKIPSLRSNEEYIGRALVRDGSWFTKLFDRDLSQVKKETILLTAALLDKHLYEFMEGLDPTYPNSSINKIQKNLPDNIQKILLYNGLCINNLKNITGKWKSLKTIIDELSVDLELPLSHLMVANCILEEYLLESSIE